MNALLFRGLRASASLQSFTTYREVEQEHLQQHVTVNSEGEILEYETLELRIHPPNVEVDNETYDDRTVFTIDSANRPGTLVEVVQCLTELGLSIRLARISSDGGWFVDEFHVSETPSGRVLDTSKLAAIKKVLHVGLDHKKPEESEAVTVFQMVGPDVPGAMAQITQLLMHNGCELRSLAVWTYQRRAACVLGVTEHARPIKDRAKLERLRQILQGMVGRDGDAVVTVEQVYGPIHHERRLHQLMLADEQRAWRELVRLQKQVSMPFPSSQVMAEVVQEVDAANTQAKHEQQRQQQQQRQADTAQQQDQARSRLLSRPDAPAGSKASSTTATNSNEPAAAINSPVHTTPASSSTSHHKDVASASTSHPATDHAAPGQTAGLPRAPVSPAPVRADGAGTATTSTGPPASPLQRLPKPPILQVPPSPRHVTIQAQTSPRHTQPSPRRALSSPLGAGVPSAYGSITPQAGPPPAPEINIQHSAQLKYWLVSIRCPDRNKLFFDTVCTLADMRYDVYHGTIDQEGENASQLYYVRQRFGSTAWNEDKAAMLRAMLESAVQRRFPLGRKVHVFANNTSCLAELAAAFQNAGLAISRCKVRAYENASHTFYLQGADRVTPSREQVQRACQAAGGELVDLPLDQSDASVAKGLENMRRRGTFAFTFRDNRRGGMPAAPRPMLFGLGDRAAHGTASSTDERPSF